MGLLDSFEKGLERAVNSAFAKTFRSGIQPVEIAAALRRELDTKAAVVSRDRILAPNSLTVRLSPADDEKMSALGTTLVEELDTLVQKHAKAQGYSFAGPVSITIRPRRERADRHDRRGFRHRAGQVSWRAVVDIDGKRHPLTKSPHRDRPRQRRRHHDRRPRHQPQARRDPLGRRARDGARPRVDQRSFLDGRKVGEAALTPESTVRIGRTEIVFRVVAQSTPPRPSMPPAMRRVPSTCGTGASRRERTDPPAPAHRLPPPALVLRLRGRLLAARRPVRRQGAQAPGGGSGRARAPRPPRRAPPAPRPPRRPSPRSPSPRHPGRAARRRATPSPASSSPPGRRRASSCRSAPSRSRSGARASRASSSATTTRPATTPGSCCGATSG